MIKFLKAIILTPIFVLMVDFAVSNRDYIPLKLYPFEYKIETPIYLLLITIFIFSTLICGILSFFSTAKIKSKMKAINKELKKTNAENVLFLERIKKLEDDL